MAVGDKRTCKDCGRGYIESAWGHVCKGKSKPHVEIERVEPVHKDTVDTPEPVHTTDVDSRRQYKTEWQRRKRAESQQYTYPDLPPGMGKADFNDVLVKVGPEAVRDQVQRNRTARVVWGQIDRFPTEKLPVDPFDPRMLPRDFGAFIENTAARMDHTAPDYVAVCCMVCAAGLIGGKAAVRPKRNDTKWIEPATLWGLAIGSSSSKKSPPLKVVMSVLNAIQAKYDEEYREALPAYRAKQTIYKVAMEAHKSELTAAIKGKKGARDRAAIEMDIENLEREPVEPLRQKKVVINDSTVERLIVFLADNPMGLLVFRDEIAGLIYRLRDERHAQENTFYLESFNGLGNAYEQARMSRDDVSIPHTILSIMGSTQPSKIIPILRDRAMNRGNDGFIERLQLMVYPDVRAVYSDIAPDEEAEKAVVQAFNYLAEIPEDETKVHSFDAEAQAIFDEWSRDNLRATQAAPELWQSSGVGEEF